MGWGLVNENDLRRTRVLSAVLTGSMSPPLASAYSSMDSFWAACPSDRGSIRRRCTSQMFFQDPVDLVLRKT